MFPPIAIAAPRAPQWVEAVQAVARFGHQLGRAIAQSALRQRWIVGLALAYFLAAALAEWHLKGTVSGALYLYVDLYLQIVPAMIGLLLFLYPLYIALVIRPARPFTMLIERARSSLFTVERIATALPVLLLLPIFLNSFTVFKSSIAYRSPFNWDARFETADRWLHGGVAPWQLLQPWLGTPAISHFFNLVYVSWFVVLWFVLIWQVVAVHDLRLRAQFLGTMMLCWVLIGSVAAVIFSSAGPCYFGRATGLPDPYGPLMAYLHEANRVSEIWALTTQERLWSLYADGTVGLGGGISAMPSMHVSMTFLFVLLGWRVNRLLGIVALVFCVAILIGSVHLGWHYAIDGYAAAALTGFIWWAVGRALDRHAGAASGVLRRASPSEAGA